MKTLRIFSMLAFMLATVHFSFAQTTTENVPVSGNCEMCKKTIETAAKKAGATKADWDVEKKILAVAFNSASTNMAKIQKGVAAAGYDTRDVKADDKAYNKLPGCCKYDREATANPCCEKIISP